MALASQLQHGRPQTSFSRQAAAHDGGGGPGLVAGGGKHAGWQAGMEKQLRIRASQVPAAHTCVVHGGGLGASAQSKANETNDRLGPRRDASPPRRVLLRAWIGRRFLLPRIICRRPLPLRAWAGWEARKKLPTAVQQPRLARPPFIPPPGPSTAREQITKAAATADQVPWQMGTGTTWHLGRAPQTRPASTFCCRYGAREWGAVMRVPAHLRITTHSRDRLCLHGYHGGD